MSYIIRRALVVLCMLLSISPSEAKETISWDHGYSVRTGLVGAVPALATEFDLFVVGDSVNGPPKKGKKTQKKTKKPTKKTKKPTKKTNKTKSTGKKQEDKHKKGANKGGAYDKHDEGEEERSYIPGLDAHWSWGVAHANNLGQVDWDDFDKFTTVKNINWPDSQKPFFNGAQTDDFSLDLVGHITIPSTGLWRFSLGSDGAAALYINDHEVIYDDIQHTYRSVDGYISLQKGVYNFELTYLERSGSQGLVLQWADPSGKIAVVPESAFSRPRTFPEAENSDNIEAYWSTGQAHATALGQVDWYKYDNHKDTENFAKKITTGSFYKNGPSQDFAGRYLANINVPTTGAWTFNLGSDDAAALLIDNQEVIYDGKLHSFGWKNGTVTLSAGAHAIEVRHLERAGSTGLVLTWKGPGDAHEWVIPSWSFSKADKNAFGSSGTGGLHVYWQNSASYASSFNQVDWNLYDTDTDVGQISYKYAQGPFYFGGPSDNFAAQFTGSINIPASGSWTFNLGSDEAASLLIDGQVVSNDSALHSYRWAAGSQSLAMGQHTIEIRYLDRLDMAGLHLTWKGPSDTHESIVPASALTPGTISHSPSQSTGVQAYWTTGVGHATTLGQIDWNDYSTTTTEKDINWKSTTGSFYAGGPADNFAVRLVSTINIPTTGNWTFKLGSDEAGTILIDGAEVLYDGQSHAFGWQNVTLALQAGPHAFEVRYLERSGSAGLVVTWKGPGVSAEVPIPTSAFTPATFSRDSSQGLRSFWATGVVHASTLGQVDWADYDATTLEENISWRPTQGSFYSNGPTDDFSSRHIATLAVPVTGTWTFDLGSDDAAALLIDGQEVVYNGALHPFQWKSGSITLTAGNHALEVRHLDRAGSAGLMLTWQGPGMAHEEVVSQAALTPGDADNYGILGGGSLSAYWTTNVNYTTQLGQVDWSKFDSSSNVEEISFGLTQNAFYHNGPVDNFAGRFLGTITVPVGGSWIFDLGSDEAAEMLIDGSAVISDDKAHAFGWKSGTVVLSAGSHDIDIRYLERSSTAGLILTWQGPNDTHESIVPASAFAPVYFPTPPSDGIAATWYSSVASSLSGVTWANPIAKSTHNDFGWKPSQDSLWTGGHVADYAGVLAGKLIVPETGLWTFNMGSDDAAELSINGSVVVSDPNMHGFRWKSGTVYLTAGIYPIETRYLQRSQSAGLMLTWKSPTDLHEHVIEPKSFQSIVFSYSVVRWKETDPGK